MLTFLQFGTRYCCENKSFTMLVNIFFCMTLLSVFRQGLSEKARIAIVGSGIGGSSCSYFLQDRLKGDIDVDIYEANIIGGRLATAEYAEEIYEVGGCAILERNKYMNTFREKFQLEKSWSTNGGLFAIRGSDGYKLCSSQSAFITFAKIIWKYGVMSLCRLRKFINQLLERFDKIYPLQENGNAFATVKELFAAVDPNILPYFKISAREGFRTHVSSNKKTIDDFVRATLRVNYGQSTDVHMFLGSVSVSCMFNPQWGIQGGVKQVPELLVQESRANFLYNRVRKIALDDQTKEYIVESVSTLNDEELVKRYDVVVIAHPITADSKMPIEFANFNKPITVAGRYQRIAATLVAGNLEASYFNWYKNYIPDMIIENDDPLINSVSKSSPITEVLSVNTQLWKIFSQRPLTKGELEAMFQTPEVVDVRDWLAYPKYEKLSVEDGNFVLHDRLFYVNAIEWAASAMEMSVIGAKNVSLLVEKEVQALAKFKRMKK